LFLDDGAWGQSRLTVKGQHDGGKKDFCLEGGKDKLPLVVLSYKPRRRHRKRKESCFQIRMNRAGVDQAKSHRLREAKDKLKKASKSRGVHSK